MRGDANSEGGHLLASSAVRWEGGHLLASSLAGIRLKQKSRLVERAKWTRQPLQIYHLSHVTE